MEERQKNAGKPDQAAPGETTDQLPEFFHLPPKRRRWPRLGVAGLGLAVAAIAAVAGLQLGPGIFGQRGASAAPDPVPARVAQPATVAREPAPAAEPASPPAPTPTAGERWARALQLLDSTWERDWPGTIAILDGFAADPPEGAADKLYAALYAHGLNLARGGYADVAAHYLGRAAALQPERGFAQLALANLDRPGSVMPAATPAP